VNTGRWKTSDDSDDRTPNGKQQDQNSRTKAAGPNFTPRSRTPDRLRIQHATARHARRFATASTRRAVRSSFHRGAVPALHALHALPERAAAL